MATHASPEKVTAAMRVAGISADELARRSGIREGLLREALVGTRRLGVGAMTAVANVLGDEWYVLSCDHSGQRGLGCAACGAPNVLSANDLADVKSSIAALLAEAQTGGTVFEDWPTLGSFADARVALIAIGSDLKLEDLQRAGISSGEFVLGDAGEIGPVAEALARFLAQGDVPTEELVGLDIDIDLRGAGTSIELSGWELTRLSQRDLDAYEVVPGVSVPGQQWDRKAAASTWWLRRDQGLAAPLGRHAISIAHPTTSAFEPMLALALSNEEPPRAISHATAQRGRGVSFSIGSQQTDYVELEDGRLFPQYGPYVVQANDSTAWTKVVSYLASKVSEVGGAQTQSGERYLAAAGEFLGVARTLYEGWGPLPRIALDMSTVAEKLLLSGANEGEIIRRVSLTAGWLGGVDDEDRVAIKSLTKSIYNAGSKYRHGGTGYRLLRGDRPTGAKKELDVLSAYDLLRRLLVHGLAVEAAGESIARLCDEAQATAGPRVRLEEILNGLYVDLGLEPTRFTPSRRRPLL